MDITTEVILCTYNGSAHITEQLHSIFEQTVIVSKVSVYDDQSSDDTMLRILEFIQSRPEHEQRLFKIHVNPSNLGYAHNFCHAITNATEDILFLCDQDDIWEPGKVAVILQLFEEHGTDMVFSDGSLIDDAGQHLGRISVLGSYGLTKRQIADFSNNPFEFLIKRNYVNGAAAAIRRIAAQIALPLPCDMPHDYWLAIWCSLHKGVVATPQSLYRYRQHQGNTIGIGSRNLLYHWLGIWRQPYAPRERELRIWVSVNDRIALLPRQKQVDASKRKVAWLASIVTNKKSISKSFAILKSIVDGSYKHYSSGTALLRDLTTLIR